jgi:hypothetical protein
MIKSSVDLRGLQPQMVLAYVIACKCYGQYACVITSCSDSKHGPNSLHYKGLALDLRTQHLPTPAVQGIVDKLKESLGPQFDVVLEDDHIHVEWDPKDKPVRPEER